MSHLVLPHDMEPHLLTLQGLLDGLVQQLLVMNSWTFVLMTLATNLLTYVVEQRLMDPNTSSLQQLKVSLEEMDGMRTRFVGMQAQAGLWKQLKIYSP